MKKNKSTLVILGTGISGLAAAWSLRNSFDKIVLIGDKLGGQMKSESQLGPRIIQADENTKHLILSLEDDDFKLETKIASIGYETGGIVYKQQPDNFKSQYEIASRGVQVNADYSMSAGAKSIKYFDYSFDTLIDKLSSKIYSTSNIELVIGKVVSIEENKDDMHIVIESGENTTTLKTYKYRDHTFYSTIMAPIFFKLLKQKYSIDFDSMPCNFYSAKLNYLTVSNFDYIYSISGTYHRLTFIKDSDNVIKEIIVESVNDLLSDQFLDYRKTFESFKHIATIPKIIDKSLRVCDFWFFLGRFAQWEQKIKLNEVLETVNSVIKNRKVNELKNVE